MTQNFTGKKAMGAIGSPVVLITGSHDGHTGIMTASMVAGISFSPPLVSVSMSHHSHTRSLIEASGELAINIISPDQVELAKNVGASTGRRIDKFREFAIETVPGTAIAGPLVKSAHTVLECTLQSSLDIGKHMLYVALVVAYHETDRKSPLFLYHGQYYSLGERLGPF